MKTVGLLGFGAIGMHVVDSWDVISHAYTLSTVFGRRERLASFPTKAFAGCFLTDNEEAFLSKHTDIVVEAVGHPVTFRLGPTLAEQGRDLYLLSVGVMAVDGFRDRLERAARRGGCKVKIPAGALAGFDGLQSLARTSHTKVRYLSRKPPSAWLGTPAEAICDLHALTTAKTLFRGSARDAARLYPKNANLSAAVALAGIGMDATEVELIADPSLKENIGVLQALSDIGSITASVSGPSMTDNVKTSVQAAASIISALLNQATTTQFV